MAKNIRGVFYMPKNGKPSEKAIIARNQVVAQHNDFIRHARNQLLPQEQNIVYFLISKVKPNDKDFMKITFTVEEFCEICGMDWPNGKNHRDIKKSLKSIRDKSVWVETGRGCESLVSWIDTYEIWHDTGVMTATLSQSIKPFLLGLIDKGFYTQAELRTFLALKSKYSKRIYEILKSYLNIGEERRYRLVTQVFEVSELKRLVSAEKYERFKDFRVNVLDIAMREINAVTDIVVDYAPIKQGRITAHVQFSIQLKKALERLDAHSSAEKMLSRG